MSSFAVESPDELMLESSELLSNFFARFKSDEISTPESSLGSNPTIHFPADSAVSPHFLNFVSPKWAAPFEDLTCGLDKAQIQGLADLLWTEMSWIPTFENSLDSKTLWESLGPWKYMVAVSEIRCARKAGKCSSSAFVFPGIYLICSRYFCSNNSPSPAASVASLGTTATQEQPESMFCHADPHC